MACVHITSALPCSCHIDRSTFALWIELAQHFQQGPIFQASEDSAPCEEAEIVGFSRLALMDIIEVQLAACPGQGRCHSPGRLQGEWCKFRNHSPRREL